MTGGRLAGVLGLVVLLTACHPEAKSERPPPLSGPTATATSPLPPVPSSSTSPLGAGARPTVWIGGTLTEVTGTSLTIHEAVGSDLRLHRLARGATGFFDAAGGTWHRLSEGAGIGPEQPACVETLMDGANLLALRVFLGASCGPT